MKTVAIVQARLRSTRLPAKVLLLLPTGRTVLEETLFRCREARMIHQVVVAIPDTEECDLLLSSCGSATVVLGPENDVLERYRRAAEVSGAQIIVRVTSDCPLIAPAVIDRVVRQRNAHALPYASNCIADDLRTYPLGYSCEAFTAEFLKMQARNSRSREAREHVTPDMRQAMKRVPEANVRCPDGDYSHLRLTLDTIDDYIEICRMFEASKNAMDILAVIQQGEIRRD